jgi:hypothetical protein
MVHSAREAIGAAIASGWSSGTRWGETPAQSLMIEAEMTAWCATNIANLEIENCGPAPPIPTFGDIPPPQENVFMFVDGIHVSAPTPLARVRKQTMAQAVQELEELGDVERRPDPSDRHARLVLLTPPGGRRPVAIAAGRRVLARWAEFTSLQKIESLRRSLQALLSELQERNRRDRDARETDPRDRRRRRADQKSAAPGCSKHASCAPRSIVKPGTRRPRRLPVPSAKTDDPLFGIRRRGCSLPRRPMEPFRR